MEGEEKKEPPKLLNCDFSEQISELQKELAGKRDEEAEIEEKIGDILRRNVDLPRTLNLAIARIKNRLTLVQSDASQLNSSLQLTSVLAENVSAKVRDLDLAKTRVVECLQRVDDLLDLGVCTEGVQTALQNEDYEQAAQHIHRFLTLDQAVFQMGQQWQQGTKTAGNSMKHSYEVLQQAEIELKTLVEEKFDEAVAEGDVASMERFFKIFPLLNLHEIGLERFGRYLCTKIELFSEKNYQIMCAGGQDSKRADVLYADTLTHLFEGIARIIEVHQPLVETYYGQPKMLVLIKHLQMECDKQTERILDEFVKKRQYDSKAKLIDTYARQITKYQTLEKLDPVELDVLLSEVTLMHTRAELYVRFLRRRVSGEAGTTTDQVKHWHNGTDTSVVDPKLQKINIINQLDQLINNSKLGTRMQELLGSYISMEAYYMSESVEKAMELDKRELDGLCSSMVEDALFILGKSLQRSLSSSSVDCVCAMLNNAVAILDTNFFQTFKNILKQGYPSAGSFVDTYQQTALAAYQQAILSAKMAASGASIDPSSSSSSASISGGAVGAAQQIGDRHREQFLTALNNLRHSSDSLRTLKHRLTLDFAAQFTQQKEVDRSKLEHGLSELEDMAGRFDTAARQAIEQLTLATLKHRLKTPLSLYADVTHTPTESEFADFEANDPFIENFIHCLDTLLAAFQSLLLPANYQELLVAVCSETLRQLEKAVLGATFNRLGGLQLDKELRLLTAYMTGVAGSAVREKALRLNQIVSLLNVDSVDEAQDLYRQTGLSWRLTPNELRKCLSLRIDLPSGQLTALKL